MNIKNNLFILLKIQDRNSIRGRFAKNISWSLIGSISSKIFIMVTNILFGRILGASQLGELSIVQNTIALFSSIASIGLSHGVTMHIAEIRSKQSEGIREYIQMGLLLAFCIGLIGVASLFLLSPTISTQLNSTENLKPELLSYAFTIIFISINNVQFGALSGLENFKKIAFIYGIRGLLSLILGTLGSLLYQVKGALIGLECSELLTMVIGFVIITKLDLGYQHKGEKANKTETLNALLKFGGISMIGTIATTLAYWYCNILLVRNSGYEAVGIYNAADKWKQFVIFIPTAVSPVFLPMLSNFSNSKDNYNKIFRTSIIFNMIAIFIPLLILVIFSKFAMGLFGTEFEQGNQILVILLLSSIFSVLNGIIGKSLISLGGVHIRTVLDIIFAAIVLVSTMILVPSRGPEGMALAHLISCFITSTLVYFSNKILLSKKGFIN